MSFNPDPAKQAVEVTFSRKKIPVDHPLIFFNDETVMKADEHKHLGVVFDTRLTFSSHIQSAINKTRCGVGMLRFLQDYLSRKTLNSLYKLYVRSHLDYGDVIHHIPQKVCDFSHEILLHRQMERIEAVQYSAGLAITCAWKGTSRNKIYEELGWESLNDRKWRRRLILFFKFINNLAPEYTRHPIPQTRLPTYALKNHGVVGRINARTERFQSSFYLNCLQEWNSLATEIRESPTVSLFKNRISSLIRPAQKPLYGIYDPKGIALLTQLRVGLSKLNSHKFNHNFRDTVNPMCLVDDRIENTEHFLLHCHAYDVQRCGLLGAINEILQLNSISNPSNQTLVHIVFYGDKRF